MRSLGLVPRLRLQSHALSEHVFGPEHAILKLVTVIAVGLLLYAAFGSWKFRVDASAQLNTDSTRLISAQFDGRIDKVYATAGDLVKKDVLLVSLDTRELEQQQSELTAEISKAETEVNKNRAEGRLADTEIAQARLDQSLAKAQRMESYLQNANSRAPFEGVIVEGERKDMLGAPVKKGDKLFKLAKIEGLYVTLMVTERQMRYVKPGATGEVALLSHADHNIPIRVNSVIPVAQVKGQEGNQFMITAELLDAPQAWWRPGMTGLARLDAGDKNIAWILTHRIVDNLRLLLWW
nr:efflux RND transporter periplasmic adaptor subunit [Polaromonas sp. CG_9.11]